MTHQGNIVKLGDDIDTDIIIPTQFMTLRTVEKMIEHAFSPLRPGLYNLIKKGDILVCGKNFGCGSSREQAPEILKKMGLFCVVAKSFARIFYRNAINNGLLLIQNNDLHDAVKEGQPLTIDMGKSKFITSTSAEIGFGKIPETILEMISKGGLVNYWKEKNEERNGI